MNLNPSMQMGAPAPRVVTVLVAAMGGEGGAVLADWLISAASAQDFPVQSTSVPGVAQRTGATTYYVEIYPVPRSELGGAEPVLSLTPNVGDVDIVAASELVEAGRVLQGGFVHPQRTTLVASLHREYAIAEKSGMGDARYDGTRVIDAAQALAERAFLFDMRSLAWQHGTVINTVMFGAMAGSGALPLSREACEEAIRRSGKAVQASLKGFAAGFEHVRSGAAAVAATPPRVTQAQAPLAVAGAPNERLGRLRALPTPVQPLVAAGLAQLIDYQGERYAALYLDRVEKVAAAEQASGGDFPVTRECARYLALWMSYEDLIRVADLKTRRDRLARVREEVGARDGEPLRLTEYLKPGLDEICSMLPTGAANWLQQRLASRAHRLNVGLHMRTDTVAGFAMLCALRALRPWRPRTSRYAREQQLITRWLAAIDLAIVRSPELAHEVALCGNLVKGYGQTSERGHRSLTQVLDDLQAQHGGPESAQPLIARVRAARQAALTDPEGRALASTLGLAPPPLREHPIRIVRRKPAS